jgi:dephospho-CoA kinase
MLVIGLTGSAAMGKSTVAAMFARRGVAVFDADRAVHRLYAGAGGAAIAAAFPEAAVAGVVDRGRLGAIVLNDPAALARLEAIVHPLVAAEEAAFREREAAKGRRIVLLDIPLLFETGGERRVDVTVVASAPVAMQRERLLRRPGMDAGRIAALDARQMSDAEKRRRAHFVIATDGPLPETEREVADVIRALAGRAGA